MSFTADNYADELAAAEDAGTISRTTAAAGDSIAVAVWTIVARVSGLAKFAAIGAVLGPTFFGNTYQFTNSLPNLVYYGFLAGSLFSSLLVPALVQHIDAGDRAASQRVAGGFLGVTAVALVAVAPVAIFLGPLMLRFGALAGGAATTGAAQERVARWLILMFIPQIFLYGVVGTATAAMNARRRFALAAAAPAIESLGIVAVLVVTALVFGSRAGVNNVSTGEMLLLGFGTTGAVALHAATQWWGAKRAGITLIPRAGWRDREVRAVVRRALPSLVQAGLQALQVLALLIVANTVAGGVVAFQIALNFYYLAIAVGATPVALAWLPRLARMHVADEMQEFHDTLLRGLALGFFITIPAAAGYLALATPLARAVSFGKMNSTAGVGMVSVSLMALSVAVIAQTAFMIATYASYARKDTRTPMKSMMLQAVLCLGLVSSALLVHGSAVLLVIGLAFSGSVTVAAWHLTRRVLKGLGPSTEHLTPSLLKIAVGAAVMVGPAWACARVVRALVGDGGASALLGTGAAVAVGGLTFLAVEAFWKAPEVAQITGGLSHLGNKARHTFAGVTHD